MKSTKKKTKSLSTVFYGAPSPSATTGSTSIGGATASPTAPSPPAAPPLRNNTAAQSQRRNAPPPPNPHHGPPPPTLPIPQSTTTGPLLPTNASQSPIEPESTPVLLKSIRCKTVSADGTYRFVTSKETAKMVQKNKGKKLVPDWSIFHLGPTENDIRSLLVHDIGHAVMTHVPMLAPTFNELQDHQREAVPKYLSLYYAIPESDKKIWSFVEKKAIDVYKNWKCKCRKYFVEHGDPLPYEFQDRTDQWEYLVSLFKDSKNQDAEGRERPIEVGVVSGPRGVDNRGVLRGAHEV